MDRSVWFMRLRATSVSLSSGPISLFIMFFTASLMAVMMDVGTTVDSELCGLANAKCSREKLQCIHEIHNSPAKIVRYAVCDSKGYVL